jgi:hypothetical protein
LSGVLLDATTSTGLADQDVTLTAVLTDGSKASVVVETDADGAWSYTHGASVTATYTARYAGTSNYAASTSRSTRVLAKYRLVLSDISPTASARKRITATGALTPAEKDIVVTIHRIDPSGKRHITTRTRTNATGHWTAHWHMARGKHKIDATVPSNGLDRGAVSRTVVVHRT